MMHSSPGRICVPPRPSAPYHNAERTKAFAERYGDLRLADVTDQVVAEWLSGGNRSSTVMALRALFNDAASGKAGRLIERNPFAKLGLRKTTGSARKLPPDEEAMWDCSGTRAS